MQPSTVFNRSFVIREGRFTKAQRAALVKHWPDYGIETENNLLNLDELFVCKQAVILDIGFGNGDSLLSLAKDYPDINFLGVEVYRPGIGNLFKNAYAARIENIRVVNIDVVELLQNNIATESLAAALIWFADPWPKKRHHKRRLIQNSFLQLLAKKLIAEGELNIATDWQPYAEHIQATAKQSGLFEQIKTSTYFESRPQTKFEQRGIKMGHKVTDLVYRKT